MEKVSIQLFDNKAETEKSKNKISLEEHKAWPSQYYFTLRQFIWEVQKHEIKLY